MDLLNNLLSDPDYLRLPLPNRLKLRREFFEANLLTDPDFNELPKDNQLRLQDEFLGIQEESERELAKAKTGLERYQTAIETGAAGRPFGIPLAEVEAKVGRPLIKGGLAGATLGVSEAEGFGPEEVFPIKPLTSKIAEEAGRFAGITLPFAPLGVVSAPLAKLVTPGLGRVATLVRPTVRAAIEGGLFGATEAALSDKDIAKQAGIDAAAFAGFRLLGLPLDILRFRKLGREAIRKAIAEAVEESPIAKEVMGYIERGQLDKAQELIEQQIIGQADKAKLKGLLASKVTPLTAVEEAIEKRQFEGLEKIGATPEKQLARRITEVLKDINTPETRFPSLPEKKQAAEEADQALANKFSTFLTGEPSRTAVAIEDQLAKQSDQEVIARALGITREQLIEQRMQAILKGLTPDEIAQSEEAAAALKRGFQPFQITETQRRLQALKEAIESEKRYTGEVQPRAPALTISKKINFEESTKTVTQKVNSPLAKVLLGGEERIIEEIPEFYIYTNPKGDSFPFSLIKTATQGGKRRYLLSFNKETMDAGALVNEAGNLITIRTEPDVRKIGLAQQLLKAIENDFGQVNITPETIISKSAEGLLRKLGIVNTIQAAIQRERLSAENAIRQQFPIWNIYNIRKLPPEDIPSTPAFAEAILRRERAEEGIVKGIKERIERETVPPGGVSGITEEELKGVFPPQPISKFRLLPKETREEGFPSLPEKEERARQAGDAIANAFKVKLQKDAFVEDMLQSPKTKRVLEEMGLVETSNPPHVQEAMERAIENIEKGVISNEVLPPTFNQLKKLLDRTFGRRPELGAGDIGFKAEDINKYRNYVQTPSYLADKNPLFRPWWERGRAMVQEESQKNYDISKILLPLDGLPDNSLKRVFSVLLEGTQGDRVYSGEELTRGVEVFIYRNGVRLGREVVKLTPEELSGYHAARNALARGKEMTIQELRSTGFTEEHIADITKDWKSSFFPFMRHGDRSVVLRNVDQLSGKPLGEVVGSFPAENDKHLQQLLQDLKSDVEFGPMIKEGKVSVEVKKHDAHYKGLIGGLDPLTLQILIRAGGKTQGLKGTPLVEFAEDVQDIVSAGYMSMGFRQRFLHRRGIPGFETEDLSKTLNDYFKSLVRFTTVTKARRDFGVMLQQNLDVLKQTPNLLKEIKDWTQYITSAAPEGEKVRNFLFLYYLTSIKSAFVNNLQVIQTLAPYVGERATLKAMWDIGIRKNYNISQLSQKEREMFAVLARDGNLSAQLVKALAGERVTDMNALVQKAGFLFNWADEYTRVASALGGYRHALKKGLPHEEAIMFAKEMVEKAAFNYSKINRPPLTRGGAKASVFMFKTFTINYLETLMRLAHAHNYTGLGKAVGALIGLGGVFAFPGFDILKKTAETLGYDPETYIREFGARYGRGGRTAALALTHGVLAPLGIDISRSIMVTDSFPSEALVSFIPSDNVYQQVGGDVLDLLGPAGGVARNTWQGTMNIYKGIEMSDNLRISAGIETMLPPVIQAPIRQTRRLVTGVETTRSGEILTEFPRETAPSLIPPRVRRLVEEAAPYFAFVPTSVSEAQAARRAEILLKNRVNARTANFNERLVNLWFTDRHAFYEAVKMERERNAGLPLHERTGINSTAIREAIRMEALRRSGRKGIVKERVKEAPRKERKRVKEIHEFIYR